MKLEGIDRIKIKNIRLPYDFIFVISSTRDNSSIEVDMSPLFRNEDISSLEIFAKDLSNGLIKYKESKEIGEILGKVRDILDKHKLAEIKKDAIYLRFSKLSYKQITNLDLERSVGIAIGIMRKINWNETLKRFSCKDIDRAFCYLVDKIGNQILGIHLVDEQLIFDPTCWKCWNELTNCMFNSKHAKFPFKVDSTYLKDNHVFKQFLAVNQIRTIRDKEKLFKYFYKCPRCGYDRWTLSRIYYPYLYLYCKEIQEGKRNV